MPAAIYSVRYEIPSRQVMRTQRISLHPEQIATAEQVFATELASIHSVAQSDVVILSVTPPLPKADTPLNVGFHTIGGASEPTPATGEPTAPPAGPTAPSEPTPPPAPPADPTAPPAPPEPTPATKSSKHK